MKGMTEYSAKIVIVLHANNRVELENCIESIKGNAKQLSVSHYSEDRGRCPVGEDEPVDKSKNVI